MSTTQIIQLMGVLYFVFGLAFLFNKKHYLTVFKEMVKSKSLMFMGSYIAFVLGFIIILFFNTFEMSKEGLITIIGWMTLLKGVSILLFPKLFSKFAKNLVSKKYFDLISFSVIVLGILLMYLGFMA